MNFGSYLALMAISFTFCFASCNSPDPSTDQALINKDEDRQPGNDGGLEEEGLLDAATSTVGGIDSYSEFDASDSATYYGTVGANRDNPNFDASAQRGVNDPITPGRPLAAGFGQLEDPELPATSALPRQANSGSEGERNSTAAERRSVAGLGDQMAQDMDGGQDGLVTVRQNYGDAALPGQRYRVSAYQPAIVDRASASYEETKSKFHPVVDEQNYVRYQPAQLSFTRVLDWNEPERAGEMDALYRIPSLSNDCDNAVDAAGCNSRAFNTAMQEILSDDRVAYSIAQNQIDGFSFEVDKQGGVLANSIEIVSGGRRCASEPCIRFYRVLAPALLQQKWQPGLLGETAAATRVMVPLQYQLLAAN